MRIVQWFESVLLIFSLLFTSISGYINSTNNDAAELQKKTSGYIYGVCHPDENYELIDDIGFGWVRFDIPYLYNANGCTPCEYTGFFFAMQQKAKPLRTVHSQGQ